MDKLLFSLGEFPVTLEIALYAAAGVFAALLLALVVMSVRANKQRADEAEARVAAAMLAESRAREAERHLSEVMQRQSEMSGV